MPVLNEYKLALDFIISIAVNTNIYCVFSMVSVQLSKPRGTVDTDGYMGECGSLGNSLLMRFTG